MSELQEETVKNAYGCDVYICFTAGGMHDSVSGEDMRLLGGIVTGVDTYIDRLMRLMEDASGHSTVRVVTRDVGGAFEDFRELEMDFKEGLPYEFFEVLCELYMLVDEGHLLFDLEVVVAEPYASAFGDAYNDEVIRRSSQQRLRDLQGKQGRRIVMMELMAPVEEFAVHKSLGVHVARATCTFQGVLASRFGGAVKAQLRQLQGEAKSVANEGDMLYALDVEILSDISSADEYALYTLILSQCMSFNSGDFPEGFLKVGCTLSLREMQVPFLDAQQLFSSIVPVDSNGNNSSYNLLPV